MMYTEEIPLDPSFINVLSWLRRKSVGYLKDKARIRKEDHKEREILEERKRRILKELSMAYFPEKLNKVFKKASSILDAQKSALQACGYIVFDFPGRTESRLIVGMANDIFGKQVFEVGLSWDPLLNLPYIPASSLKGAFRSYIEMEKKDLASLLGTKEEASSIVFLNAYPINSRYNLLVPEVTTPIYKEQEGKIRETEAEPSPITYLAINKDVAFRIIVGVKLNGKAVYDQLRYLLQDMLKRGVGAKTLLGYGVMELS
ncbi:type III-B CRISPR module RAMP protein Cmr6 [Candidatus Methanodesulfokora washburnensis]|uniref:Type III-B CRISPR module RAMP protein Cmr6 n=1 Tax=Candidatus Methanodesulfokora washburnensis TaxID=2478471 RepID=A0A3R9QZN7_9CREN|nr:type III-B CRISPR module RAMP protein Cmr6 [Candidatus Methanodesulfokores washburnensis]RSN77463.1 type III-B CRISPR module RAMP protein Cmr6 [Candidatus Methanodesulfokores washburnensis]